MLALDNDAIRAAHARHRAELPADWPLPTVTAALDALLARGLPDTRSEAFRYTNLAPFAARLAGGLAAPDAGPEERQSATPALAAATPTGTVFVVTDGRKAAVPGRLPAGLTLAGAAGAVADATTGASPLADLNTAFATDALVLELAAGARPPAPVVIHDQARSPGLVSQPRLAVRLGADSELTLIQVVTGSTGTSANSFTRLELGAGARLTLIRLQESATDACRLDRTELLLAADARATATVVDLGGAPSRQDLIIDLAGDGADVDAAGLCLAGGASHVDHQVTIGHRGRRTTSRSIWRSVADGRGRIVFNGRISVAPGAAGTDAALSNRNLLLSAAAEIDTKPELEILTDDVRCSHGATTGQLDPAALFYLRSRGLPAAEARRVLIDAFTASLLARITDPELLAVAAARASAVLEAT